MVGSRPALVAVIANIFVKHTDACTAIGVGKDASASGFPMLGHTEDSGPTPNDVRLIRVPGKKWPAGSRRPLYDWQAVYPRVVDASFSPEYAPVENQVPSTPLAYIPQVESTFGYWDTDYGVMNERGLAMGESTCTAKTVGWPSDKPYGYNRAGIEDLSKIAMERCSTARCAVQTMGDLGVELGFYSADSGPPDAPSYGASSECLVVGDAAPGEIWVFNIMTGKANASAIWAAERHPSDHVVAVGNSFTIRKMNLTDQENFLHSPGVTDLAEEMGWWNVKKAESPEIFDFFRAYGYTPSEDPNFRGVPNIARVMDNTLSYYSARRMWRIYNLLSPEVGATLDRYKGNLPSQVDPLPSSVPAPKGSVTLTMLQSVFRDHYEGTEFDLTQGLAAGPYGNPNRGGKTPLGIGQWERAISMHRTSWSFILESKPHGRGVTWFGWDAPHGTAYLPFFAAATVSAPNSYSGAHHMGKFNTNCAWWAFNLVNQYQDLNFQAINVDVLAKARGIEAEGQKSVAEWEAQAAHLPHEQALDLLTAKSNAFAEKKVGEWWELAWALIAKYRGYVVTRNETVTGEDVWGQQYPMWWLENPEVGFTSWSVSGPFHGVSMAPVLPVNSSTSTQLSGEVDVRTHAEQPTALIAALLVSFPVALSLVGVMAYHIGVRKGRQESLPSSFYVPQP